MQWLCGAVFTSLFLGIVTGDGVSPLLKVIELLEKMQDEGEKEKQSEALQFTAYKQFCGDTLIEKQNEINVAKKEIEFLNGHILRAEADVADDNLHFSEADQNIFRYTNESDTAAAQRKVEHADYIALHQDYTESIDAIRNALVALKRRDDNKEQASTFLELALPRKVLQAFLDEQSSDTGAPEAYAYEFQSSSIIDLLNKLEDKFVDERTEAEKSETDLQHEHNMLQQTLKAQIAQAKRDKSASAEAKAKTLQATAIAEKELSDTTSSLDANKAYLADLTSTCQQKATDYKTREELRTQELVTLTKAIAILKDETVSGAAHRHLPGLLHVKKVKPMLAQIRVESSRHQNLQQQKQVAHYLQNRAGKIGSRVLAAVAERVAEDPFDKVKRLIQDLITRLQDQATSEVTHKAWCDGELATNDQTRTTKTRAIEELQASIDGLQANIAKLHLQAGEMSAELSKMQITMANATKLREEEALINLQTVKEAQKAQKAVATASTLLREFYESAGIASSMMQRADAVPPPIFDEPYTGMQKQNLGIIGLLEIVMSDFVRLEAETTAAEASAKSEYNSLMVKTKVAIAKTTADLEHHQSNIHASELRLGQEKDDLEGTQNELSTALAYFEKLKPSCVNAGVTFEVRTQRREEEIQSLQEALRILNGEDLAAA